MPCSRPHARRCGGTDRAAPCVQRSWARSPPAIPALSPAGPPWYWGDKNPLKGAVGKTVTIVGEQSGDEVDVQSIDGTAIRPPGKPPWAGGPLGVGSSHPGWSQAKATRMKDKIAAKQQREAAKAACRAAGTCGHDDESEESAAPSPS